MKTQTGITLAVVAFLVLLSYVHGQFQCACQYQIRQVCGRNGRTYDNACLANCAGTSVDCRGSCPCNQSGLVQIPGFYPPRRNNNNKLSAFNNGDNFNPCLCCPDYRDRNRIRNIPQTAYCALTYVRCEKC
ncbi:hypothetical protein TCAL_16428 [Tigriopus californicus]|uniref:Kazal-like domain-containing protein n=1 Tax=Tigriopus californicus TaxID=6832 RepID=A0A553NYG6_TIGCA|nr:hypothetical protein TCAL_16428 [Tigriopus californicus]